jgi:cytosine/adenosine deaminase-related metal-dependent hydrolase
VATTASADQFTQMHAVFGSERGRRHQASWDENLDGLEATPDLITARQVLRWATLDGRRSAGLGDQTGSITPGKKADIVIIDGHAVNTYPVIDPVAAVVCAADVSNVDTGHHRRRHPQAGQASCSPTSPARAAIKESRDYLVSQVPTQEGWVVPALA